MTYTKYIQPSVNVTEIIMVQTLCISSGGGSSSYSIDPDLTTDEQL